MKKQHMRQIVVGAFLVLFSIALYLVNRVERDELMENEGRTFEKAEVVEILQDNMQESGTRVGQQIVNLRIRTGEHKGEIVEATSTSSYLYGADCTVGLKVIAIISEYEDNLSVSVYNYDRGNILYGILIFFLVVLWAIGGKKGLNSALGLVFTFVCIIFLFLPMVYRGYSPILCAILVAVLTTVVVMYLIDGMTIKTGCAILGTIAGVAISALFAYVFGKMTHISGYNVSDIESLDYIGMVTDIQVGELMFAGILISALGAVMDVAMSVTSTINEIHEKNPGLSRKELFQSGINVGKDMMGTMSNTLILAFAGGSINTLIYIYSYKYNYYQVLNMYDIGIEIIQGISATLGVVLTVPFVAMISVGILKNDRKRTKNGCKAV
ncbi:MAG: YibE/F family protein [Roseburia sp.]